jgi:hypothetical protein
MHHCTSKKTPPVQTNKWQPLKPSKPDLPAFELVGISKDLCAHTAPDLDDLSILFSFLIVQVVYVEWYSAALALGEFRLSADIYVAAETTGGGVYLKVVLGG